MDPRYHFCLDPFRIPCVNMRTDLKVDRKIVALYRQGRVQVLSANYTHTEEEVCTNSSSTWLQNYSGEYNTVDFL